MFNELPSRPPKSGVVKTGYNFQELDKIMLHPVYGWASWICVLNPSKKTFERLKPLIDEAYSLAKNRFQKRVKQERIKQLATSDRKF